MAVKIRMTRTGTTNSPCFRVVAVDSKAPRDGACIEFLGWYDPRKKSDNFSLKLDRINYWLENGAQASDTVNNLIKKARKNLASTASEPVESAPEPAPEPAVAPAAPAEE